MVLLIGNFLSEHGLNPNAIEDLATALSNRYETKTSSNKKNPLFRLFKMALSVISNRKSCKLIIVDVFSTYAFIFSYLVIVLAKLFNIPYIPVFRGGNLIERYRKHPNTFNFLFSNASTIISPSTYFLEFFDNMEYPIKMIPNYIDLKKYSFKSRKKIKPHLLWVRSIHKIYNPQMAIHVLDKISKIYPDVRICMVGPTKDDTIMEQLKLLIRKLELQDHVTFSGKLSKIEWAKLSENYDIFINTTDYDNNPITLLESMALGLPIISTNVGGVSSLIDNTEIGLLVEPNDSDQMAKKIIELISGDIDGNQIARNAQIKVSKYDKKNIIPKWYAIIDKCLK